MGTVVQSGGNMQDLATVAGTNWIDPVWKDSNPSDLELRFAQLWVETYPELDLYTEYRFSKRKFRFDFCHLKSQVAIEIQGGKYQQGTGHNSASGSSRDREKINLAQMLGWVVLQLDCDTCEDGKKLKQIAATIRDREV